MNLIPLNHHIIVKRVEADTKTAGGIIIPDSAKEKPTECEVMSVPNGETTHGLNVGDVILVGKYSGNEVTIEGQDYLILDEDDALCVVEK